MSDEAKGVSPARIACPFCRDSVSGGNVTNLYQHVKIKHPERWEAFRDAPMEAPRE